MIQVNTPVKTTQPKIHILKLVDRSSVGVENWNRNPKCGMLLKQTCCWGCSHRHEGDEIDAVRILLDWDGPTGLSGQSLTTDCYLVYLLFSMARVNQVWPLTQFFLFPLCNKSLIYLEGKSMTPSSGKDSSSVPPSNSLVSVSDPWMALDLHHALLPELQKQGHLL